MNSSRGSKLGVSASAALAPFCIVAFGVSASSRALSLAPSIAAASACLERIPCAISICFAATPGLFRALSPCCCALWAIPQRHPRATVQSSCQTDVKCVSCFGQLSNPRSNSAVGRVTCRVLSKRSCQHGSILSIK